MLLATIERSLGDLPDVGERRSTTAKIGFDVCTLLNTLIVHKDGCRSLLSETCCWVEGQLSLSSLSSTEM